MLVRMMSGIVPGTQSIFRQPDGQGAAVVELRDILDPIVADVLCRCGH